MTATYSLAGLSGPAFCFWSNREIKCLAVPFLNAAALKPGVYRITMPPAWNSTWSTRKSNSASSHRDVDASGARPESYSTSEIWRDELKTPRPNVQMSVAWYGMAWQTNRCRRFQHKRVAVKVVQRIHYCILRLDHLLWISPSTLTQCQDPSTL